VVNTCNSYTLLWWAWLGENMIKQVGPMVFVCCYDVTALRVLECVMTVCIKVMLDHSR